MKTLLIVLLALFSQSMAVAEPVEDAQARYESYIVKGAEFETMHYMVCVAQKRSEGKHGGECNDYGGWPMVSLEINRSAAGEQALVNSLSLELDLHSSEGRKCTIQRRGKTLLSQLQKMDITKARNRCVELLKEVRSTYIREYPNVTPEDVCYSENNIDHLRDEYIDDIKAGKICGPWDYD